MIDDDESWDGDGEVAETEKEVSCPYCGEVVEIVLDPSGGAEQEYVEDCPVCCNPWHVHVHLDEDGAATVWLDADEA